MIAALLVDDEPAHRLIARRALIKARSDISVTEAESLAVGRATFDTGSFTLLVIDLNLAGVSGLDLIRYARSQREALPIIAISTSSLESDISAAYVAGANIFVSKADGGRSFPADLTAAVEFLVKP